LSRYSITFLVAIAFGMPVRLSAQGMPALHELPAADTAHPGPWTDDYPLLPRMPTDDGGPPETLQDYAIAPGVGFEPAGRKNEYVPLLGLLGLRHSHTHGRHIGRGGPLVTTSWLNRPYYVGAELGTIWLTRPVYDDVTRDVDAFGGVFLGWDRDPYWGAELRFDWATPELTNREARDADRTDSLFMWNYSLLYYPWGDAKWRPYWRAGIGDTRYDFPLDDGTRHDQWMLTFPIGVGVKYPLRRWLAARAEITDHL
jgi:hypothetical protein